MNRPIQKRASEPRNEKSIPAELESRRERAGSQQMAGIGIGNERNIEALYIGCGRDSGQRYENFLYFLSIRTFGEVLGLLILQKEKISKGSEAWMILYFNWFSGACKKRNSHWVIEGLEVLQWTYFTVDLKSIYHCKIVLTFVMSLSFSIIFKIKSMKNLLLKITRNHFEYTKEVISGISSVEKYK